MLILCTFGLLIQDASAKRFGGGRSIGFSRPSSSYSTPYNKPGIAAQAATKAGASKWGGILGGALIGGLLASLFMGHGLGLGILAWLGMGLLCLFIFSLIKRKVPSATFQGATSTAGGPSYSPDFVSGFTNVQGEALSPSKEPAEAEAFLREAKGMFIRLQTAYDDQNVEDIRQFTSPELLAEIQLQLHERANAFNYTEVVSLDAELLDMSSDAHAKIASVRFTGSIKENGTLNTNLNEIWHFCQTGFSGKWVVSGIQQTE